MAGAPACPEPCILGLPALPCPPPGVLWQSSPWGLGAQALPRGVVGTGWSAHQCTCPGDMSGTGRPPQVPAAGGACLEPLCSLDLGNREGSWLSGEAGRQWALLPSGLAVGVGRLLIPAEEASIESRPILASNEKLWQKQHSSPEKVSGLLGSC